MNNVSGVGPNDNQYWEDPEIKNNTDKMNIENLSIFFTTILEEHDRNDFNSTFKTQSANTDQDGAKFLKSLIDNKTELKDKLGISEEEYDNLACIAMAIATQETGMGEEKGYDAENKGIGEVIRDIGKRIQNILDSGAGSASSGLTQMKIYDFINGTTLTEEQKKILSDYGINAENIADDNLYNNPDLSAIATMVVLTSITQDYYPKYVENIQREHAALEEKLDATQRDTRGQEVMDRIMNIYQNADNKGKEEIRTAFKQWLLSANGSTDGLFVFKKEFNEEHNLKLFNDILNINPPIVQEDLDYIRYTLSKPENRMNITQYAAYAWNNGTGNNSMQFDRYLAGKLGTIYTSPEVYDYDQYVYNVESIAKKYAQRMIN